MSVDLHQARERAYQEAIIIGSRLIHADKTVQIFSIENRFAAAFWFDDTKWCVKENPWFSDYLELGPLLLLRSLTRSRNYLLSPPWGEFRNIRNRGVSLRHFVEAHPSVAYPLRRMGVFWHPSDTGGEWANRIYYCPPVTAEQT